MYLSKRVRRQLVVFSAVAIVGGGTMAFGYLDLPQKLFGIGQYKVTVNLPAAGGLYTDGNVTYRGVEVGRGAADVHRQNASRSGRDGGFDLSRVDLEGLDVGVDEDRDRVLK